MIIHKSSHFSVYFGDAQDGLMPVYYLNLPDTPLLELEPFSKLKAKMGLKDLIFLHQTHSERGSIVTPDFLAKNRPFKTEGDYLVTGIMQVGIGVMTADCLPIVFFDTIHHAIAVIHAGWRGSVLGVAIKALETMQEAYGTKPEDVAVFFGPSALGCCYEVSADFGNHLEGLSQPDKAQVLVERDSKFFFDNSLFNQLQLQAAGIRKEAINAEYNLCTMCDSAFYSHRRDREAAGRQMTVINLI
jgi:YfiH family protein